MKIPKLALGFPLLVKELTELAARRRTYIVRVLYAVLLFIGALLMFWENIFSRSGGPLSVLGRGNEMFHAIVGLQFAGIYLFLPAMTCTAITAEKERDSLSLLFLTRLGPSTILFEKLVGRLIPMFTFLLLALPLMAFAYTFGGMDQEQIWGAIVALAITAVQIAALSLMCSAYFRTTVGAFVATYLIGATMFPVIPIILSATVTRLHPDIALAFFAPYAYFGSFVSTGGGVNSLWGGAGGWTGFGLRSIPLVLSTLVFLGLARFFLIRRAFAQPRRLLQRLFKNLDGIFWKLNNNRITRGVVLVGEGTSLPEERPVAWRETTKKSLGRFRYLVRIFICLEIPVALICTLVITGRGASQMQLSELTVTLCFLWVLAALIVSVQAASLISGERSRQTLDVLLATPLSGRDIVLQKMQGLRRLMWVLAVCFLTIFLCEVYWYGGDGITPTGGIDPTSVSYRDRFFYYFSSTRYLVCSILSVIVYLPMVAWLSFLIGLKVKTQTRAIIGSLAALVAWCILPLIIVVTIMEAINPRSNDILYALVSPMMIIPVNENNQFGSYQNALSRGHLFRWLVVLGNFAFYGGCAFLFRWLCLRHADRYLGRREDRTADTFPPQPIITTEPKLENAVAVESP